MNFEFGKLRINSGAAAPDGQPSRATLRARLHAALLILDALCIFVGFFAASVIYEPGSATEQWLVMASVLYPVYLAFALNARAYSAEGIQSPARGLQRAVRSLAMAAGTVVLVAFYLKTSESYSRVTVALGTILCAFLLSSCRYVFLAKAKQFLGGNPFSIVLITDGTQQISHLGFSLVLGTDGRIDPADDTPFMFDLLAKVLKNSDRVLVACAPDARLDWLRILKGAGIRSEIIAPELSQLAPLDVDRWNDDYTIVVAEGPLTTFEMAQKRALDLMVALAALIVLSPVFLVTALAIKLESRGPIFFSQTRIGRSNRIFTMLKFRSMKAQQSDTKGDRSTARDDDRVTRVGSFIRRTSIDELPQLVNVLLGDMSIVGPRPHALGSRAESKLFWEIDQRYWHRHAIKPGLTGLAQVRGFRGATLREQDLTNRLQADLEYLSHWSIWKDLRIILMTFLVIRHKNAF